MKNERIDRATKLYVCLSISNVPLKKLHQRLTLPRQCGFLANDIPNHRGRAAVSGVSPISTVGTELGWKSRPVLTVRCGLIM